METILYLIRHGETSWNKLRRIQGHSNIELNEIGERQAEKLAARFSRIFCNAIYSSDLSRAYDTALPLSMTTGIPIKTLAALRERCYGQWEGLTYEEIKERFHDSAESKNGIESVADIKQRAFLTLTELAIKHPKETIAVVSHGGFINSFLHYVTNGKQGTGITRIDNTSISTFRYRGQSWEVLETNDTEHLQN